MMLQRLLTSAGTAARAAVAGLGLLLAAAGPGGATPAGRPQEFSAFLASLRADALASGISGATWRRETAGLTPDLSLPGLDRGARKPSHAGQREFSATPAQYLADAAMAAAAAQGRRVGARHRIHLAGIARRHGVPAEVLLAIYGRETSYGANTGKYDALRTLVTQAWAGRRRELFRHEFIHALKMLDEGVTTRAAMKSSWAGAMGLAQMLPSQYFRYGEDGDGDGRVDIWKSVPDALASIARHLRGEGWRPGERWAHEVVLPAGFDCTFANPDAPRPWREWRALGLNAADGRSPPAGETFALITPAGAYGPGFLIGANYFALKAYNYSDLYVLYIGHLADRIAGGDGFATPWRRVTQPSAGQLADMQRALARLGFYADRVDGFSGMKTRLAVGAFQKAHGLRTDCWPGPETLAAIGVAAR